VVCPISSLEILPPIKKVDVKVSLLPYIIKDKIQTLLYI
jgi:hypothetical protein